jgi:hypothetical protein
VSGKQFFERIKGPMNNYEDWYSYRIENGHVIVTHDWSHVSPSLSANHGSKEYTFEEFQKSEEVHVGAKVALDEALKAEK